MAKANNAAAAKPHLKLSHSPIASEFHLMDQISESLPLFFQIPEYKETWRNQYGFNTEDEEILSAYQKIRQKYQKISKGIEGDHNTESGLFAPHAAAMQDPIFDAFFSAASSEQAWTKLSTIVTKPELDTLKSAFSHFAPKITSLIKKTDKTFETRLATINRFLADPKVSQHLHKMSEFYGGKLGPYKSIQIVWTPELAGFSSVCYGDHLYLRFPFELKEIDDDTLAFLGTAVIHEATHHISGSMPAAQKQALSNVFIKKVAQLKDPHMLLALEEPLVLATQAYYLKNAQAKLYEERKDWLNHPLTDKYLALLEETLKNGKKLDQDFVTRCAELYLALPKEQENELEEG